MWMWYTSGSIGNSPDSKLLVAHMGPTWGRQDPGGPHVGYMNLAIWVAANYKQIVVL